MEATEDCVSEYDDASVSKRNPEVRSKGST